MLVGSSFITAQLEIKIYFTPAKLGMFYVHCTIHPINSVVRQALPSVFDRCRVKGARSLPRDCETVSGRAKTGGQVCRLMSQKFSFFPRGDDECCSSLFSANSQLKRYSLYI